MKSGKYLNILESALKKIHDLKTTLTKYIFCKLELELLKNWFMEIFYEVVVQSSLKLCDS